MSNSVLGLASAQCRAGATIAIAACQASGRPLYESLVDALPPGLELIRWKPQWSLQAGKLVLRGLPTTIRRQLVAWRPDVVHIHGEFNPDNLRVPNLFACPLVLSPHGAFHPVVFRKSNTFGKQLYFRFAKQLFYRKAAIHVLTPQNRDYVRQLMDSTTLYVAPNGGSAQIEPFLPAALADTVHQDQPYRLLYVGRLDVYTKGLDLVLEAIARLAHQSPARTLRLTLVGLDWAGGRAALERQAHALGIAALVDFPGPKVKADLAHMYLQADCYLQCSRHEGQSLAATDALLFGLPALLTIAMGLDSYSELTTMPQIQFIAPQVEAITAAIGRQMDHRADNCSAARAALPIIRQLFGWDSIARTHLVVYERLVAARR